METAPAAAKAGNAFDASSPIKHPAQCVGLRFGRIEGGWGPKGSGALVMGPGKPGFAILAAEWTAVRAAGSAFRAYREAAGGIGTRPQRKWEPTFRVMFTRQTRGPFSTYFHSHSPDRSALHLP